MSTFDSIYIIDTRHRNEQDRVHRQAILLLKQGQTLPDTVNYLRAAYKKLWYKWRVSESRSIGDSRHAERQSLRKELDA
jgi:hypothetical protein